DMLMTAPGMGRTEALRRVMMAYMNDTSEPRNAYARLPLRSKFAFEPTTRTLRSFHARAAGLDWPFPFLDLCRQELGQIIAGSLLTRRHRVAERFDALLYRYCVQRLADGCAEPLRNYVRGSLWQEQCIPSGNDKLREALLRGCWDGGQHRGG